MNETNPAATATGKAANNELGLHVMERTVEMHAAKEAAEKKQDAKEKASAKQ